MNSRCPRRARAEFYKRWSPSVGSSAASALFTAMFFAGIYGTARVVYDPEKKVLRASAMDRPFALEVPKNGYTITIIVPGKPDVRVNDPVDVRQHVPPPI